MADRTEWIPPSLYVVNTSGSWKMGVKSASGIPMLEYGANLGADANVVILIPVPAKIDAAGIGAHIKDIKLWHYVSATSAGVTPISAAGGTVHVRELVFADATIFSTGKNITSAGTLSAGVITACNALTAGLPSDLVSGTDFSPTTLSAAGIAIASLWTSAMIETFTGISKPAEKSGQVTPYVPRNSHGWIMAISASLGASAVWEHYGALVTYN